MLLAASASILFTSGCAFWEDDIQEAKKSKKAPQAAGAPQMLVPQNGKNNIAKPIVVDEACCPESDMMVAPVKAGTKVSPPPLPNNIAPAAGTVETRLTNLEKRVDVIDSTVNQMKPALLKLDLFDKDIENTAAASPSGLPPVKAPPKGKKAAEKAAQQQFMEPILDEDEAVAGSAVDEEAAAAPKKKSSGSASGSASAAVNSIRMADNAGKTRIVFDLSAPAEYSYDIDNGEKILVVSFPGASAAADPAIKKNALIDHIDAMEDGAGSAYVIALKKSARIVTAQKLGPSNGSGHRVFFDIAPE